MAAEQFCELGAMCVGMQADLSQRRAHRACTSGNQGVRERRRALILGGVSNPRRLFVLSPPKRVEQRREGAFDVRMTGLDEGLPAHRGDPEPVGDEYVMEKVHHFAVRRRRLASLH